MTQARVYMNILIKKMVVTETSKVHNDYEFVPTSDTLPKITSQRRVVIEYEYVIISIW